MMVSWFPYIPSSVSTRGRPIPVGAFHFRAQLGATSELNEDGDTSMLSENEANSELNENGANIELIKNGSTSELTDLYIGAALHPFTDHVAVGLICRENGSTGNWVCHLHGGDQVHTMYQFWVLVAAQELTWQDYHYTQDSLFTNALEVPNLGKGGSDDGTKTLVGRHGESLGFIQGDMLLTTQMQKELLAAGGFEEHIPWEQSYHNVRRCVNLKKFQVLVQSKPSSLKDLCRKKIRKLVSGRNRCLLKINLPISVIKFLSYKMP